MGKRIIWTKDQERYLLEHYSDGSCADLALHFGVSVPTVSAKLRSMGVTVGRGVGVGRKVWSAEEEEYIRDHFPKEPASDVADVLGVSSTLVRKKAMEMGLKKSADYDRRAYFQRYVRNYRCVEQQSMRQAV